MCFVPEIKIGNEQDSESHAGRDDGEKPRRKR